MTFNEAEKYINQQTNFESKGFRTLKRKWNLNRMMRLCRYFENPQGTFPAIHIAGSKGKGSTALMIASIYKEAGLKVGLYTSPHIDTLRERIQYNGRNILQKEFAHIISKVKQILDRKVNETYSYFEIMTLTAFIYFRDKKVDIAVIETGLGGRYDATNIIKPVLSIVTSICLEHTNILGKTLKEIAREKAMIIKRKIPALIAVQKPYVKDVFMRRCHETKSKLYGVCLPEQKDPNLSFREMNEALSRKATHILTKKWPVDELIINKGLRKAKLKGRVEVLKEKPLIICDVSHTKEGIRNLIKVVKDKYMYKKMYVILSVMRDKNYQKICRELKKEADYIYLPNIQHERALFSEKLSPFFDPYQTKNFNTPKEALRMAISKMDKDDMLLITGSFYLVGDLRQGIRDV